VFKLAQSNDYFWPVSISYPAENGRTEKATFDAKFRRISQSRIDEIQKAARSDELRDGDLIKEVLIGWKGVVDDSGEEIPFSESARDQLLNVPMMSYQIAVSFMGSLTGAQRKN
jgi:hypothetical protein